MLKSAGGGGIAATDTPVVVSGAWTFTNGITVGNVTTNPVSSFLGTGLISVGGGITSVGTMTGSRFIPTSSVIPSNGIYLPGAGQLGLAANSGLRLTINSGSIGSIVVYTCSAAGSAASPSYALTSGNGMYLAASGQVGITAASGLRLTVTATETLLSGNLVLGAAGNGLQIKTGTNARIGAATLVAGTVTVSNTSVKTASLIWLTRSVTGGTVGHLSYTIIDSNSFTINSSLGTDTSTINWLIIEPAP